MGATAAAHLQEPGLLLFCLALALLQGGKGQRQVSHRSKHASSEHDAIRPAPARAGQCLPCACLAARTPGPSPRGCAPAAPRGSPAPPPASWLPLLHVGGCTEPNARARPAGGRLRRRRRRARRRGGRGTARAPRCCTGHGAPTWSQQRGAGARGGGPGTMCEVSGLAACPTGAGAAARDCRTASLSVGRPGSAERALAQSGSKGPGLRWPSCTPPSLWRPRDLVTLLRQAV